MHSTLLMMLLMAVMMIPNADYEDPDRLRGGFDGEQAFRGDLTLFNVWDSLLSDAVISRLGRFFFINITMIIMIEPSDDI